MIHHHDWKLLECRFCSVPNLIKYGVTCWLGQRYKCQTCGKTFSIWGKRKQYTAFEKKQILHYAQDRSIRKAAKLYHLSVNTIRKWRDLLLREDTTATFVDLNSPVLPSQQPNGCYMNPIGVIEYRRVPIY